MNSVIQKIKDIISKISADKKTLIIVAAGIIGIVILVMSEFLPGEEKTEKEEEITATGEYSIDNHYEYAEMLEKKLTDIISSIEGAGTSKVMITLESSSEAVYAQNDKTDMESDNENGEKISKENDYVLIKTDSSKEEALLLKIIQPEVKGVAVVCEGGDSVYVQQKIIETISAVFDINSSKIKVTKLSSGN